MAEIGYNDSSLSFVDNATGTASVSISPTGITQNPTTGSVGRIILPEDPANGVQTISISAPSSLANNRNLILPSTDPTTGQVLRAAAPSGNDIALTYTTIPTTIDYLSIIDTTSQNIVTPGTFQNITFNTNVLLNGWTHTAGSADIVCPTTGIYFFSGFAHINRTGAGTGLFEFRLTINGVPAGTVFAETINTTGETKNISATGILPVTAGQIVRAQWTGANNSQIQAPVTVGATKSCSISIFRIA